MFNRKDMYKDFSDESLTYYYDTVFNGDVNAMFEWSYGDTTSLTFTFEEEDVSVNSEAEITFYDFRYEELYKINVPLGIEGEQPIVGQAITGTAVVGGSESSIQTTITLDIDAELSKTFKRGVYYCSSKVIDAKLNTIKTIIPQDRGLIFVR